jgi:hypothetical protein
MKFLTKQLLFCRQIDCCKEGRRGLRTRRKFVPAIIATVFALLTLYGRRDIKSALAAALRTMTSSSLFNMRTMGSKTAVSLKVAHQSSRSGEQ